MMKVWKIALMAILVGAVFLLVAHLTARVALSACPAYKVQARILKGYGEKPIRHHLTKDGKRVYILFFNEKTGSYTLLLENTSRSACVIAVGKLPVS